MITAQQIETFQRDGAVMLPGMLTDWMDTIRAGIDRNMDNPSQYASENAVTEGRFFDDYVNWTRIPEFERLLRESPMAQIAAAVMQSETAQFFHDHVLVKDPGTPKETPWHQDQPYYNVDGNLNCSMWAPVDPVVLESTLEFNAGSHKRGWLMPRTFMDNQAKWFPEGSMSEIPNIEADRDSFDVVGWELHPGDAVFFHMLTTHHAYGVPGKNRRRAFSLRFLGDDMVHAPRDWVTSPNFDGLNLEIPAGEPMDHELFPVLRDAAI